jgi:hypothetical protein
MGLREDTHLTSSQYSWISSIFCKSRSVLHHVLHIDLEDVLNQILAIFCGNTLPR